MCVCMCAHIFTRMYVYIYLMEGAAAGAQFTRFTGTKVQILTQKLALCVHIFTSKYVYIYLYIHRLCEGSIKTLLRLY